MIYQAQRKGCGYACVKMLLSLNGVSHAEEIEEPLIRSQAPSLGELISFAQKGGLTLSGYKFLEPSGLLSHKDFPILLVLAREGVEHMVVVMKPRGGRFLVLDPDKGRLWVKKEELSEASTGVYLKQLAFRKPPEGLEKPPYKRKRKWGIGLTIFPILESLLALCGLSCLRRGGSFLLLSIFLLFYCLCLASRTVFSFQAMKSFDLEFLSGCYGEKESERRERLSHYCAYKEASLLSPLSTLEDGLSLLLVFLLLFFNDPFFGSLCLLPIFSFLLQSLLFRKKDEKEREGIESGERKFLTGEGDPRSLLPSLEESLRGSYAFGERKACLNLLNFSICAFSSALSLLLGPVSSNRFLFCLFSSSYLLKLAEKMLADFRLLKQGKKEWPYFCLHFLSGSCSPKGG